MAAAQAGLLPIATVLKPHGVRGGLKIVATEDHEAFFRGNPEVTIDGVPRRIRAVQGYTGALIVFLEGVDDRNGAEALRGKTLDVQREALQALADEQYYLADLEGCTVRDLQGRELGVVRQVHVLPANDVLAITLQHGGELLAPFTKEAVPTVDIAARTIDVDALFLGLNEAGDAS